MLPMNESSLSLKEKTTQLLTNCPKVLKILYDSPVKYYFLRFRYMISRL